MNTKTETLMALAEVCGEELSEIRLKTYLFALKDLSHDELKQGVFKLMNDPSLTRFPMPGKIVEAARPNSTVDEDAKEAAGRIVAAVSKFGYPNRQEAREYIGELGWQVVEMQGGWSHLCESMTDRQIPILQAQFRDLAKTVHKKSEIGKLGEAPALPESKLKLMPQLKGVGE